jgi:hypothetical protein
MITLNKINRIQEGDNTGGQQCSPVFCRSQFKYDNRIKEIKITEKQEVNKE